LGPGRLGHFFAILSFVSALFSAFSYFRAAQTEVKDLTGSRTWLLMGRNGFVVHVAAAAGIFFSLYYIITNHLYEYYYAWQHSSRALPMKYLLSCFWEGQEGSFMLWSIWHAVLGLVVMRTAGVFESRVMAVITLVQACLATMLLGFYLGPDIRIGSSPFVLLREQMQGAPIFAQANYLEFIRDGNGLNPLLQNYWMVIHPPVLFLGFAATLIPFAYTVAALWKGSYTQDWINPVIHGLLFAGAVLGAGIMMGGAWAYESLTFGGYWAWDPVENASLVPWLTLIAGLHTLIVYKATGRTLSITLIFLLLTYLLVWYSTFLTRTGILGDTSVHSFTGEGKSLTWHLLIVIALLLALSVGLLIKRWKQMPRVKTEEEASSREFWMFIGSFVLLLSALQISISTSVPVWSPLAKLLTGKDVAPPVDPVSWYNSIQLWVAIIVALLSAAVLFLRFKRSDMSVVWRRLGISALVGLVLAIYICLAMKIDAWQYALLMFASCFSVVANLFYALRVQQGPFRKRGASITHLGFGLMLVGILLSSYKKEVISLNTLGVVMDFGKKTMAENAMESRENALLFRNTPVVMGEYTATYLGDSVSPTDPRTFYRVRYERRDSVTGQLLESFTLYPDAFINPKGQEGLIANPDSRHYLTRDIFTYVTSVIDPAKRTDTASYKEHTVRQGDTVYFDNGYFVFNGFNREINDPRYVPGPDDRGAVSAGLQLYDVQGYVESLNPVFILRKESIAIVEDTSRAMGLYAQLAHIIPEQDAAVIRLKQTDPKDDYIVLKAIVFPYINVLWLGIVVMVIGFFISLWNRIVKSRQAPVKKA